MLWYVLRGAARTCSHRGCNRVAVCRPGNTRVSYCQAHASAYEDALDAARYPPERWWPSSDGLGVNSQRPWRQRARARRARVVDKYGGCCACCGEPEPRFLEIDHILNDGKTDRLRHPDLMGYLDRSPVTASKYQILCSNCNQGKRRNGGICPHRQKAY